MNSIQKMFHKPWLFLIIVILGTGLKFYKLDYSLFWYDEVATVLHTSGHKTFQIPLNEIKNIQFYEDQFHLKNHDENIFTQLKGLCSRPNLNPLHYSFLMMWYRIAGDGDIHYRLFNVLFLILTLPVLFLLTKKLFSSSLAGWIAISLYAVSPYFHFFVQEARYNTLLVFLIILLHYLLLQAITHKSFRWWAGYTVTGLLCLYASVLSGLIVFGHFIFVICSYKEKRKPLLISMVIILVGYFPWILSMINNKTQITNSLFWHEWFRKDNFLFLLLLQLFGFTRIFSMFSEFRYLYWFYFENNYVQQITDILLFLLILSAIIYLIRKAPKKTLFFLLSIFLSFVLFFQVSDMIRGTGASIFWRYHAINFVTVLLIVVYFLSRKIALNRLLYSGIWIILVVMGVVSMIYASNVKCEDPMCWFRIKEAQFFSQAEKPLLITDYTMPSDNRIAIANFMVILHECSSDSIDILRASPDIQNVKGKIDDKDYSEIYVTHASDQLLNNLKSQFKEKMDSLELDGFYPPVWQINHP